MKFLFTSTPHLPSEDQYWYPRTMERLYRQGGRVEHELVEDPEQADIIVYFEADQASERDFSTILREQPWVHQYPDKCFTVNHSRRPIGYLPGLYTSMPRSRMDPSRFRASGYMLPVDPDVASAAAVPRRDPRNLCSFRGARTSSVRRSLLDGGERFPADFPIEESPRHFNWASADKTAYRHLYVESILDARFVLCPRGWGTATYRLFEVLELGRVPVILADEWVPPNGPDWREISVRLPEADWTSAPGVLRGFEDQWTTMARGARTAWEDWFSPAQQPARALDYLLEIRAQRGHDEAALRSDWPSWTAAAIEDGYVPRPETGPGIRA